MTQLPPSGAGVFATEFPEAWSAYQALGKACAELYQRSLILAPFTPAGLGQIFAASQERVAP